MSTSQFMRDLEHRYQKASRLTDRRDYKIFYSEVKPAEVMVLGINPGGDPLTWEPSSYSTASRSFYEHREHDYVDCPYKAAAMMKPLLADLLGSVDAVRDVVKTNLSFRRTPHSDDKTFRKFHGMSLRESQLEARPFLEEILAHVKPRLVILEGNILSIFKELYATGAGRPIGNVIRTPAGRHEAVLFEAEKLTSRGIGPITVARVGHPSVFGPRYSKNKLADHLRRLMAHAA